MAVKNREVLDRLVARCDEQGIRIAYDDLQTEGGFCRLRDKYIIVINRRAATGTRVRIIADALSQIEADASQPASVATEAHARAEAFALVKTEARP